MKTGYFGKLRSYPKDKGYRFVSIARFNKFWTGDEFKKLAPPSKLLSIKNEELYTKLYYDHVLNNLNAKDVYNELGDNAVLLCYEKYADIENGNAFCHRSIVAKWLEKNLNIKVEELKSKE